LVEIAFTGVGEKRKNIAPSTFSNNKKGAETIKDKLAPPRRWPMRCPK